MVNTSEIESRVERPFETSRTGTKPLAESPPASLERPPGRLAGDQPPQDS
jgi:hypothetical protein